MNLTPLLFLLAQTTARVDTAANPAGYHLTLGGWIIMLVSVGFVTGLLSFCIRRVMRAPRPNKVRAPLDAGVDTGDMNNAGRG